MPFSVGMIRCRLREEENQTVNRTVTGRRKQRAEKFLGGGVSVNALGRNMAT